MALDAAIALIDSLLADLASGDSNQLLRTAALAEPEQVSKGASLCSKDDM